MTQNGALLGLTLALLFAVSTARAQQTETLWNCKDKDGRITLTNQETDTKGKDCRVVQQQRVTVVPGNNKAGAAPAAKTPSNFPRETPTDRATTRVKQRETIERELGQEERLLADAKRRLAEQETLRSGDEKNYARVLERLQPFKDAIEVHEKNIAALKREIANLR